MEKQFRIPLIFFFIAACIGLVLRLNIVMPLSWLNYSFWLHAHSHIMFLGWTLNVLFLAYVTNYGLALKKKYNKLFVLIQVLLAIMLVVFPIQGYGFVTITVSALHTLSFYAFAFWFTRDLRHEHNIMSLWCARCSLLLFVVSSFGPFALGPLMANGMAQTKWYYFAVYYYLHFQYNGVFIFGILSLYFKLLENREVQYDFVLVRKSCRILLISLFPTYLLSILYTNPGLVYNGVGFLGALLQLIALLYFLMLIRRIVHGFNRATRFLMVISLLCFVLKIILQVISAFPFIAQMAYEVRPFIIAYLHLVLIGVVTFVLIAWYIENGFIKKTKFLFFLLLPGFAGSEIMMIGQGLPFVNELINFQTPSILLFFSVLLVLAVGICVIRFRSPLLKP